MPTISKIAQVEQETETIVLNCGGCEFRVILADTTKSRAWQEAQQHILSDHADAYPGAQRVFLSRYIGEVVS